jgi:LPXTG-motif cell wall-anchored protein
VYSLLRLALLAVCFVVLRLVLGDGQPLLVIGGAVLMSALLSLVLLKRQRDAFAEAAGSRAEQRRADRAARRSRLDAPESPQG